VTVLDKPSELHCSTRAPSALHWLTPGVQRQFEQRTPLPLSTHTCPSAQNKVMKRSPSGEQTDTAPEFDAHPLLPGVQTSSTQLPSPQW